MSLLLVAMPFVPSRKAVGIWGVDAAADCVTLDERFN